MVLSAGLSVASAVVESPTIPDAREEASLVRPSIVREVLVQMNDNRGLG
jgi:hypothetical protein